MADPDRMIVEVAYATAGEQALVAVEVPRGATLRDAILASGILARFPEIDLDSSRVGIFSKPAALEGVVHEHDRVEIYRPLEIDPRQARRQRAKKGVRN